MHFQLVFRDRRRIYFEAVPRCKSIVENLIKLVSNLIILSSKFDGDRGRFMTTIVEFVRGSFEKLRDHTSSETKKQVMSDVIKKLNDMVERHTVYHLNVMDILNFLFDHWTEQKIVTKYYYQRLVKPKSLLLAACLDYIKDDSKKKKYVKYVFSINNLMDWLDLNISDFLDNTIANNRFLQTLKSLRTLIFVLPLTDICRLLYCSFLREEL